MWDDSHQPHTFTKMKKLRHCYELQAVGPVEVASIVKSFVDKCRNDALNDKKTLRIVQAIAALGRDIWGGGGGTATATLFADYVQQVSTDTINCLTNTSRINEHLQTALKQSFSASVVQRSWWVYWNI